MNDVIANKIAGIQRCIQRACEQAIDLANHVIKTRQLGIPTSSADSFDLLRQADVIDATLTHQLQKIVHFRNVIVHRYEQLELAVLRGVITTNLDDLLAFGQRVLAFEGAGNEK